MLSYRSNSQDCQQSPASDRDSHIYPGQDIVPTGVRISWVFLYLHKSLNDELVEKCVEGWNGELSEPHYLWRGLFVLVNASTRIPLQFPQLAPDAEIPFKKVVSSIAPMSFCRWDEATNKIGGGWGGEGCRRLGWRTQEARWNERTEHYAYDRSCKQQTGEQQAVKEPTATQKMWHGRWRITSSRKKKGGRLITVLIHYLTLHNYQLCLHAYCFCHTQKQPLNKNTYILIPL